MNYICIVSGNYLLSFQHQHLTFTNTDLMSLGPVESFLTLFGTVSTKKYTAI